MPSFTDLFALNPIRATENEVFLRFTTNPIDFIKAPKQKEAFIIEGAQQVVVETTTTNEEGEEVDSDAPISDDGTQPDTPVGNPARKSFRHPKDDDEEDDKKNHGAGGSGGSLTVAIAPTFDAFVELVSQHPAVSNLIFASQSKTASNPSSSTSFKIKRDDIRYAVEPLAVSATSGFSNRFDQRLYDNFISLIKAREDAEKSREEHDKIMATRPPPTPPVEENNDDEYAHNNNNNGREIQYDEDGNEIEPDEDDDNNHHESSGAAPVVPSRPRKTRAQRKEEEKQRKEDKKREFEVEQKEHLVACMEQKLANALCAAAIRVVVSP